MRRLSAVLCLGLLALTATSCPSEVPTNRSLSATTLLRETQGPQELVSNVASLYLYLLIGSHQADQAKVLAALTAYVCEVPPFLKHRAFPHNSASTSFQSLVVVVPTAPATRRN